MADENVSTFPIIDVFKDDMYVWILDPNSSPQSKRYLLSKFIQEMRISYAIDTGVANAYLIALQSTLTSYIQGQSFSFKAVNANTGASTINIDGIGLQTIKRRDGTDLQEGDIPAGSTNTIKYDGTNFQIVSVGDGIIISNIQNSAFNAAFDSGVANAYIIALTPAPSAYAALQIFSFTTPNANTGASTLNVNGLGIKTITRRDGSALQVGDIPAGSFNIVGYDGVEFQLLDSSGVDGNGHIIQDEGTPLTDRANLNFQGLIVEDDVGNDATKVTNIQLLEGAVNKDTAVNYVFQGEGKVTIDSTQAIAFNFFDNATTGISAVTFSVRTDAATIFETVTFANLVLFLAGTHTTPGQSYSVGTGTNWEVRFEASFGVSAPSKDFGILMNLIRTPNV